MSAASSSGTFATASGTALSAAPQQVFSEEGLQEARQAAAGNPVLERWITEASDAHAALKGQFQAVMAHNKRLSAEAKAAAAATLTSTSKRQSAATTPADTPRSVSTSDVGVQVAGGAAQASSAAAGARSTSATEAEADELRRLTSAVFHHSAAAPPPPSRLEILSSRAIAADSVSAVGGRSTARSTSGSQHQMARRRFEEPDELLDDGPEGEGDTDGGGSTHRGGGGSGVPSPHFSEERRRYDRSARPLTARSRGQGSSQSQHGIGGMAAGSHHHRTHHHQQQQHGRGNGSDPWNLEEWSGGARLAVVVSSSIVGTLIVVSLVRRLF